MRYDGLTTREVCAMADYTEEYIYATIHDFKTNISRYIRLLDSGRYRAVVVKRYNKPVGMFLSVEHLSRPHEQNMPENVD